MKICYFNLDFPPRLGGMAAIANSLISQVAKHPEITKVRVISFNNPKPRHEIINNLEIITHKDKSLSGMARLSFKYIWQFRNYDVFHMTDFFPVGVFIIPLAKFIFRKKVFANIYGTDALSTEGSLITKWAKKIILKYCDKIFVISKSTTSRVVELYNLPNNKFAVIYAGINSKLLSVEPRNIRSEYNIGKDDFVVITVCRLVKRKGVEDIIMALSKIKDTRVKFIIVGDGEEMDNLCKLASGLNMLDRVIFIGAVDNAANYYYSSDVFVMTSKHLKEKGDIEGLGIVFIEAQYFGLPVIGTNSGGIPEAIDNGKSGFVVPEGDIDVIIEKINFFINSYEKYNDFSNYAKKFVRENFNWELLASKYINYYKR